MWWQYLFVFIGAFIFDVVPFPLPPAFTIMVFLQILFGLDIWWVIIIGVLGSICGRYVLTLYIPLLADKIFKKSKNEDVQFLGEKMKDQGWRGQVAILAYTLLPLPTTPIFLASGMARINASYIIPAFFVGKFTSDAITVHLGKYASENAESIIENGFSWPSIISLIIGLLFLSAILFVDWRSLLIRKKLLFNFRIWRKSKTVGYDTTAKSGGSEY
jgi:membrane protein YqaA with SNARE-associated domain